MEAANIRPQQQSLAWRQARPNSETNERIVGLFT